MKVAGVALILGLGLLTLAAHARGEDEVERIVEGFSDDGRTIHAGPLHERSRLEELRARLIAAHQRDPEDDEVTIRLAVIESRTNRNDRALALLGGISAVSTFHALALYDAGLIKLKQNRLAEAREVFSEAAAVGSGHAEPALALATTCERLGDARAAAQAFELAEKRSTGSVAATCALRAGALHEKSGALDEALAAYTRAASVEPAPPPGVVSALGAQTNSHRGRADAARVLLRLGRAADAAQELEKALEGRDDPDLRFKHGLALFLAGKPAEEEILKLEKTNPELARRLAEIVARKRDVK